MGCEYTPYPLVHYLGANSVDQLLESARLIQEGHPKSPDQEYSWGSRRPDPLIMDMARRIAELERIVENYEN